MELDKKGINEIIAKANEENLNLKVRDIAYVILSRYFRDKSYAFRVCFGEKVDHSDDAIEEYEASRVYYFLKSVLGDIRDNGDVIYDDDITFEENKAYMLKLKRDTELAMEEGELEKKDGLKILSDLSVKLNDKFSVQAEVKDHMVIVEQKFNDICNYCHHEVSRRILTKEEAMQRYNLVPAESK